MKKEVYQRMDAYMLSCMEDSAHDAQHIYRVLFSALQIAQTLPEVDYDVLITACLLHDVGRREQFADPSVCHAQIGSEKARKFLLEEGFSAEFAEKVAHCILTHRFRKANPPQTVEAKILFDADKLDVTGAVGIARTLMYKADTYEPLYTFREDGTVSNGEGERAPSFFREYKFKLERLYDRFYTEAGSAMAAERRQAAVDYYHALYREVSAGYDAGRQSLLQLLD